MKDQHCLGEISKRRDAQPRYAVKIQHIADAIVAAGYISLDSQAKALGIHRSTAWTIIKTKHKLDRLSSKTTNRMLANPELPPSVRAVIQQYLAERSVGRNPRQRQNLLTPGSTGLPDCRCGAEMRLFKVKPSADTEIRIFKCDTCHHEFQLMAWTPLTQDRKPV